MFLKLTNEAQRFNLIRLRNEAELSLLLYTVDSEIFS